MTSIFDGIAGTLNAVFGDAVTWTPAGGEAQTVQAVFRRQPVRVDGPDGSETLTELPSLKVQRPLAESLSWGDVISPGDGNTYAVRAGHPTGSPAADAFIIFELELIT